MPTHLSDSEREEEEEAYDETNAEQLEETPSSSTAPKKRKNMALRSSAWKHFHPIIGPTGERTGEAQCQHCKIILRSSSQISGTSGMLKHIRKACPKIPRGPTVVDRLQRKMTFDVSAGKKLMIDMFSASRIRRLLAEFIILEEQPFLIVERPGFIRLIRGLEPRFRMIGRKSAQRDCMGIYVSERKNLKKRLVDLSPRICLTTDTWTSMQNISYLCVTAHFIDTSWVLHKRVIGFRKIVSHTGVALSMVIEQVLKDWKLNKVLTITVDNATANDKCLETLKTNMQVDMDADFDDDELDIVVDKELLDELRSRQLQEFSPIEGGVLLAHTNLHMRCSAHILNLIVQDGLKELDASVTKMRAMIKYVKSSPQRKENFRKHVGETSGSGFLQMDLCTRWNSTYFMLQSAHQHQAAFQRMLVYDDGLQGSLNERGKDGRILGPGRPTTQDWDRIKIFVGYLQVFYQATLTFSASNSCTANLFFGELYNLKRHLNTFMESRDTFFKKMATRMHKKYVKYWGELSDEDEPTLRMNRFLFVATILDPRFKLKWFEYWLPRIIGVNETVKVVELAKKTIEDLYSEYKSLYGEKNNSTTTTQGQEEPSASSLLNDPFARGWVEQMESQQPSIQTKLELYLFLKPESFKCTILEWWKNHDDRYPVLARMARDVLAIPISTVPSEAVFSTGGRVLNSFRTKLGAGTAEGLILTQNWLRASYESEISSAVDDGIEEPDAYEFDRELASNPDNMLEGICIDNIRIQDDETNASCN